MKYSQVVAATFLRRPNRFIAYVELEGKEEKVHVKNTGRCRELLVAGVKVYLAKGENPLRKTKYDLIAVEKRREGRTPLLVNMDSQAPNEVVAEWLPQSGIFPKGATIRREVGWGKSRFDFYLESGKRRMYLEVKGVTLEEQGVASFPDAPTERGVKHLHELVACRKEGFEAGILFVIQMAQMKQMRPNDEKDPQFGVALRQASAAGVKVMAMDCHVTPSALVINQPVSVVLD